MNLTTMNLAANIYRGFLERKLFRKILQILLKIGKF